MAKANIVMKSFDWNFRYNLFGTYLNILNGATRAVSAILSISDENIYNSFQWLIISTQLYLRYCRGHRPASSNTNSEQKFKIVDRTPTICKQSLNIAIQSSILDATKILDPYLAMLICNNYSKIQKCTNHNEVFQ